MSWRTLDLSPQAGVEWLLHGTSYMRQRDLPRALEISLELCRHPRNQADVVDELKGLVFLEAGCPVGVGSGRKGLKYKGHALVHAQKMVSPGWRSACQLLNTTVSITGDLGEASTVDYRADIQVTFGHWVAAEDGDGEGGDDEFDFDFAGEAPANEFNFDVEADAADHADHGEGDQTPPDYPNEDEYIVDLSKAIYSPGPHHVLHNLTNGLPKILAWWDQFVDYSKNVCKLLSLRFSKERLLRTCFTHGAGAMFHDDIEGFNARVYDKRWGTVHNAAHLLVDENISEPLRYSWNKERYKGGGGVAALREDADDDPDHDRKGANVNTVDEAIKSKLF